MYKSAPELFPGMIMGKKMKRIMAFFDRYCLVALCMVIIPAGLSGQEASYTQFYNAPLYYNPAMTGINEGLIMRIAYRNQWPKYAQDLNNYHFSMDVAERHMPGAGGIGMFVNTNKQGEGFIKRNIVGGLGSARIRMSRRTTSQLGFMASVVHNQIDSKDFIWGDQLDNRHGLLYSQSSFPGFSQQNISYPDFSIGGVVQHQREHRSFTFGGAVHHLFKPNESFYNLDVRVPRKVVLHTEMVIFQVSNPRQGFRFNPAVLFEYQSGYSSYTVGTNISRSTIYTGVWYRNRDTWIQNYQSVTLLAGINIPMVNQYSRMKLMYSYDIGLSDMAASGGSHELTLRFEFDQIHFVKSQKTFANEYPIIYDPVVF
jgi:type IX secretion system PorP/SprF family membrane protein